MEKDTWTWLVIGTAFCGVLAVVGWIFAIYAVEQTPQMHKIVFTTDNGHQSTQSKLVYLFSLPTAQTVLFLLLVPTVIRWKYHFQKLREEWAWPLNEAIPIPTFVKLYSVLLSVVACTFLYQSAVRSFGLIQMW
jgi:hypothetical protein